jgi:hypothetical protein
MDAERMAKYPACECGHAFARHTQDSMDSAECWEAECSCEFYKPPDAQAVDFDDADEVASLATLGDDVHPFLESGFSAYAVCRLAHAYRALREDAARLDWLEHFGTPYHSAIEIAGNGFGGDDDAPIRDWIDEARRFLIDHVRPKCKHDFGKDGDEALCRECMASRPLAKLTTTEAREAQ